MTITVQRDTLSNALSTLSFISKPSEIVIFSGIRLQAVDGRLKLTTSNFQVELSVTIDASIEDGGELVVGHRGFKNFVSLSKGETIEISLGGRGLLMRDGSTRLVIPLMRAEEWTSIVPDNCDICREGDHSDIRDSMVWVSKATNPMISDFRCMVMLRNDIMVASDKRSIHMAKITPGFNGCIHSNDVRAIVAALDNCDTSTWRTNGRVLAIQCGDSSVACRLMEDIFPTESIPHIMAGIDRATEWECDSESIRKAANMAAHLAHDAFSKVSFSGKYVRSTGGEGLESECQLDKGVPEDICVPCNQLSEIIDGKSGTILSCHRAIYWRSGNRSGAICAIKTK